MQIAQDPPVFKESHLRDLLRGYERCLVAFSGGVDSALVAAIATAELGESALIVTGVSGSLAKRELQGAIAFAKGIGARHELLSTEELADERYASNPANRCYFCKSELYSRVVRLARERGLAIIADGLNHDDLAESRPGRRAAGENGVRSPLAEAGLTKDDVRSLARKLGLDVWDKPALACLSSRFPTGTAITSDLLDRVERAEDVLYDAGLAECRVRHHGELARIEVPVDALSAVMLKRGEIAQGIRAVGYRFVTLDLAGYVRGAVAGTTVGLAATTGAAAESNVIDLIGQPESRSHAPPHGRVSF